jgi:hypothetical protein
MMKRILVLFVFAIQMHTLFSQSCNLLNTTNQANGGWTYWNVGGGKIYVLFDPSAPTGDPLAPGCGLTYPFTIQNISFTILDSEFINSLPSEGSNLIYKIGVYDLAIAGDLCSGPGDLISLSEPLSVNINGSFTYPQSLNTNVLIEEPCFVAYEVIEWDGLTTRVPSVGWDTQPLPNCRQYVTQNNGALIEDYVNFFTASRWVGMNVFGTEGIILPPPPVNDNCVDAITILEDVVQGYDMATATPDGPDQFGFGCADDFDALTKDVWYYYLATCNGTASIDICGDFIAINTSLAVYPGGVCPATANNLIACNTLCELGGKTIEFPILESLQYLIRLGVSAEETNLTGGFTLETSCENGIGEVSKTLNTISIYPNPTNGKAQLTCNDCSGLYSVKIYDVLGNEIKEIVSNQVGSNIEIDFSSFSSGIYGVKLLDEKGSVGMNRIVIE